MLVGDAFFKIRKCVLGNGMHGFFQFVAQGSQQLEILRRFPVSILCIARVHPSHSFNSFPILDLP
jgi:hypothetical protein